MKIIIAAGLAVMLAISATSTNAAVIRYDIAWLGANNYTMTGMFEIDELLLGTGPIDESDLLSFSIEGFLNSATLGQPFSGTPANFNFDTTTGEFLLGSGSGSVSGQTWNSGIPGVNVGVGFVSGTGWQAVSFNGTDFAASQVSIAQAISENRLTATLAPVPIPAAVWMFGSGLGLLGWMRRKTT